MKYKNEEEDTDGYQRGMPICGDYLAGMWGCGVALGKRTLSFMGRR